MEKALILIATFLPTLIESYLDRFGESKKGKKKDTLWLVIATVVSLGLAWWLFDIQPFWPALLILMFRFTMFDYLVNLFLKKYSTNHPRINIWEYSGSTAGYDKLTAKVDWRLRIIIRSLVLVGSLVLYFHKYSQ